MTNSTGGDKLDLEQALRYAEELSALYHSEKTKRKAMEIANMQLKDFSKNLEAAYKRINNAYLSALECLALAAEYKDGDTGTHIARISNYTLILAKKYGYDEESLEHFINATPMHDIGKVGIPDYILQNPGKLNDDEFKEVQKHTTIGSDILKGLKSPLANLARKIAISHHEKWDGSGYPSGIKGSKIPVEGRIVALADVFDALTSTRPYKQAYPILKAIAIIKSGRGTYFDPELVDIFLESSNEFLDVLNKERTNKQVDAVDFQLSARDLEETK